MKKTFEKFGFLIMQVIFLITIAVYPSLMAQETSTPQSAPVVWPSISNLLQQPNRTWVFQVSAFARSEPLNYKLDTIQFSIKELHNADAVWSDWTDPQAFSIRTPKVVVTFPPEVQLPDKVYFVRARISIWFNDVGYTYSGYIHSRSYIEWVTKPDIQGYFIVEPKKFEIIEEEEE